MKDLLKSLNDLKDKREGRRPVKKVALKSKKVDLSLVDEINYKYEDLRDETGRLSYSTEEWFDEKFNEFYQLRGDLMSVYFQNSEAFISEADVAGDKEILEQIKEKSDELGMDVTDVYPNYTEHLEELNYLNYLEERFDKQVQELKDIGF